MVYFPHGFHIKKPQLELLKDLDILMLITSFSLFKLPSFLGGAVNPGKENALQLVNALQPKYVVHAHDENKHAKGLVKKNAKVVYPNFQELEIELEGHFIYLDES